MNNQSISYLVYYKCPQNMSAYTGAFSLKLQITLMNGAYLLVLFLKQRTVNRLGLL